MSFRPTISIYCHGRIVDCGYYRNWTELALFAECCRLAQALDGCATADEVLRALESGTEAAPGIDCQTDVDRVPYSDHDRSLVEQARPLGRKGVPTPVDEDLLQELESCSEFPIFIDVTRRFFCLGCEQIDSAAPQVITDASDLASELVELYGRDAFHARAVWPCRAISFDLAREFAKDLARELAEEPTQELAQGLSERP